MKKITIEEIKNRIKIYDYTFIDYYDNKHKIIAKTKDGFYAIVDYARVKNPKNIIYSPNNPYVLDNIKHYLEINETGCELLSKEYVNNLTHLVFRCKCGEIFKRSWGNFIGSLPMCPKCSLKYCGKNRIKYTIADIKIQMEKKNLELITNLSDDSLIRMKDTIKYICKIHNNNGIMSSNVDNIYSNKCNCIFCSTKIRACKRRIPEDELKIRTENKGLIYKGVEYGKISRILYICPKHENYGIQNASYSSIAKENYCCPYCYQEKRCSNLQKKVNQYLKTFGYTINVEQHCTLKPYNVLTNRPLPYDNEVVELKLIVEVNGEQHYRENTSLTKMVAKKYNLSQSEVFERRKKVDIYKEQYAIDHGYNYLVIPYYTEKNDEYKKLIDNKINEILSSK